jgi:hypothetical protein
MNILGFARVVGSALGKAGAVLYDLSGRGYDDDPDDRGTDIRDGQEVFGSAGLYCRPPDDEEEPSEAVVASMGDETIPISHLDRGSIKVANKGSPTPTMPEKGQRVLAGYGGARSSRSSARRGPSTCSRFACRTSATATASPPR